MNALSSAPFQHPSLTLPGIGGDFNDDRYVCSGLLSIILFLWCSYCLELLRNTPTDYCFFELTASQEQLDGAKKEMESKDYVADVHITTKEEALKLYSQEFKESPLLLELVTADILPASIEVSANTITGLSQIKSDLEKTAGVEDVKYQENVVDTLEAWTKNARLIGIGASVVLAVVSFLVMMVIIGMRVQYPKTSNWDYALARGNQVVRQTPLYA